ncbi:MAG: hypothetical protein QX191_01115 [Methylococcaceae bacterium]|jgi:hypothetical protein
MNLASSLSLYSATSLVDALSMTSSDAVMFFESKSFVDWRKGKESESKIQVAGVNRTNEVIRAIGILSKIMNR